MVEYKCHATNKGTSHTHILSLAVYNHKFYKYICTCICISYFQLADSRLKLAHLVIFSNVNTSSAAGAPGEADPTDAHDSFDATFDSQLDSDFMSVLNKLEENYKSSDEATKTKSSSSAIDSDKAPADNKPEQHQQKLNLQDPASTQIVAKWKRNERFDVSGLDLTLSSPLLISTPTNQFRSKPKIDDTSPVTSLKNDKLKTVAVERESSKVNLEESKVPNESNILPKASSKEKNKHGDIVTGREHNLSNEDIMAQSESKQDSHTDVSQGRKGINDNDFLVKGIDISTYKCIYIVIITVTELLSRLELSCWGLPAPVLAAYHSKGIYTMFPWQAECLCTANVLGKCYTSLHCQ